MKVAAISSAITTLALFFLMRIFGFEGSIKTSSAVFFLSLITHIITTKVATKLKKNERI